MRFDLNRKRTPRPSLFVGLTLFLPATVACAADPSAGPRNYFENHCLECHDADAKKGGLDLGALSWDAGDPKVLDRWVRVFDKVDKGDMPPPEEKDRPEPAAREAFLQSLRGELHAATLARQRSEGRVALRRLNRVEYENTIHDLLAIDLPLRHYLPEDPPAHGFDNVAEGLRLSMLHMEHFLEAADAAIAAALDLGARPEGVNRRFLYQDEESVIDDQKKSGEGDKWRSFRVLPDAVVIFDDNSPTTLRQFIFRDRGRYRIRISSHAVQAAGRPVWLKLSFTRNGRANSTIGRSLPGCPTFSGAAVPTTHCGNWRRAVFCTSPVSCAAKSSGCSIPRRPEPSSRISPASGSN